MLELLHHQLSKGSKGFVVSWRDLGFAAFFFPPLVNSCEQPSNLNHCGSWETRRDFFQIGGAHLVGTKFSDELRDFNPEDVPPHSFDSKNGYSKRLFRTMKSPRKNHRYIYSTYIFHIYIYTHTYQYLHIYIYIHMMYVYFTWEPMGDFLLRYQGSKDNCIEEGQKHLWVEEPSCFVWHFL